MNNRSFCLKRIGCMQHIGFWVCKVNTCVHQLIYEERQDGSYWLAHMVCTFGECPSCVSETTLDSNWTRVWERVIATKEKLDQEKHAEIELMNSKFLRLNGTCEPVTVVGVK